MKAEWLIQGPNSRFVVTNLSHEPKELYEFYTERGGTCEVRIDEFKNGLKADRLSCHRFIANQFRLFLHMAAYWLVLRLREALKKTEFASMQIQQLRLRLLKIGGQVIQTARRVWFRQWRQEEHLSKNQKTCQYQKIYEIMGLKRQRSGKGNLGIRKALS